MNITDTQMAQFIIALATMAFLCYSTYFLIGVAGQVELNRKRKVGPQTLAEWFVFHMVMRLVTNAMAKQLKGDLSSRPMVRFYYHRIDRTYRFFISFFRLRKSSWAFGAEGGTFGWCASGTVLYAIYSNEAAQVNFYFLLRGGSKTQVNPKMMVQNWALTVVI